MRSVEERGYVYTSLRQLHRCMVVDMLFLMPRDVLGDNATKWCRDLLLSQPWRRPLMHGWELCAQRQLCRRVVVDVLILVPRDVHSEHAKKWIRNVMHGQ